MTVILQSYAICGAAQELAVGSDADVAALERAVDNYRQALQSYGGHYDDKTAELNSSLGDVLMSLQRFEEAASAYGEALQSIRISQGLYSQAQLPVLEKEIQSVSAARKWEQVDHHFYLAMSVVENSLDVSSREFARWVRMFANWKIEAQRHNLAVNGDPRAIEDVLDYYQILIDALPDSAPDRIEKLITYTREIGLAHYYSAMAVSVIPFEEFEARGVETVAMQSCFTVTDNTGQPTRVCETHQVPNPDYFESRQDARRYTLQNHVTMIRKSFRDLISRMEKQPDRSCRTGDSGTQPGRHEYAAAG